MRRKKNQAALNYFFILLLAFIVGSVLLDNNTAYGQTNEPNESTTLSMNTLLTIVASTGIISAIGSGLFNHFITQWKLKNEQKVQFINDKAALYTFCIFILTRMTNNPEFAKDESAEKIEESIKDIDDALKDKIYLLDKSVFSKWMNIRTTIKQDYARLSKKEHSSFLYDDAERRDLIHRIDDVKIEFINQYNKSVIEKYKKIIGEKLEKIEIIKKGAQE